MDPLFEAHPSDEEIGEALRLWPELSGKKVRPLLVSAFGDIFVDTDARDVWVASPNPFSGGAAPHRPLSGPTGGGTTVGP